MSGVLAMTDRSQFKQRPSPHNHAHWRSRPTAEKSIATVHHGPHLQRVDALARLLNLLANGLGDELAHLVRERQAQAREREREQVSRAAVRVQPNGGRKAERQQGSSTAFALEPPAVATWQHGAATVAACS